MILGFKKRFVDKTKKGIKIHTIREDKKDRWKAGNKIHFATGVRTKNYKQFATGTCKSVQKIEIKCPTSYLNDAKIIVDGRELSIGESQKLAWNDGFEHLVEFFQWFDKDFTGKIIHWTNFRY